MFLSQIHLDVTKRHTLQMMNSPSKIHGAVQQCFPGIKERCLWRIDRIKDNYYLFILSSSKPDAASFIERYCEDRNEVQFKCKEYDILLDQITDGLSLRFRLAANPVKSLSSDQPNRGKVLAHVTFQQQKDWLCRQAERCGFLLDPNQFEVIKSDWKNFRKSDGNKVSLKVTTFEGVLTVANQEKFRDVLTHGIGRGKAYGCGLLTVMRST